VAGHTDSRPTMGINEAACIFRFFIFSGRWCSNSCRRFGLNALSARRRSMQMRAAEDLKDLGFVPQYPSHAGHA
jgi:hypothetical protein